MGGQVAVDAAVQLLATLENDPLPRDLARRSVPGPDVQRFDDLDGLTTVLTPDHSHSPSRRKKPNRNQAPLVLRRTDYGDHAKPRQGAVRIVEIGPHVNWPPDFTESEGQH